MIPDDRLVRNEDRTAGRAFPGAEPGLHDLTDEPIVRLIMASDNVTRPDLLSLLARIRRARPYVTPLENKTHRGEVRRNQAAAQSVARLRLP
jgi:hypothetical protein